MTGERCGRDLTPLFHDLDGETVLVFGGGTVGSRRARRLARTARVVVLAPEFEGDTGPAERVRARPTPADVRAWVDRAAPSLVIAATDDAELNEAAVAAAREAGVLANRADEAGRPGPGAVVVPAVVRESPVTVAVSTGGTSPALAGVLRRRIEGELEGAGAMADLTASLRGDLRRRGLAPSERRDALRAVADSDAVWKALRTGEPKARKEAESVIEDTLEERR